MVFFYFQCSGPYFLALQMKACLHTRDSHHIVYSCGPVAKEYQKSKNVLKKAEPKLLTRTRFKQTFSFFLLITLNVSK